jgi:hypothetical protein
MGDYQASWFLDMDDDDLEDYESDEGEDADQKVHTHRGCTGIIYIARCWECREDGGVKKCRRITRVEQSSDILPALSW